ncbi:MAG TPA: hypothetical protein VF212_12450 [Longimicrobiales bacterium]
MRAVRHAQDSWRAAAGRAVWRLSAALALSLTPMAAFAQVCERQITADVVALDQALFYNRLGAFDPAGMMYALRRDVVSKDGGALAPGNVELREGKRPRPIVLRMNVGDCLTIHFQNLLAPSPVDDQQPATRTASIHVNGLQLVNGMADDGSYVGQNASGLVPPGGTATYTYYAEREGGYLLYSMAATTGGEGDGGSLARGLFGAVNVEPRGAEWYRSQVTRADLDLATVRDAFGNPVLTPDGHPVIDYDAVYPAGHEFAGLPILRMLDDGEIVHTDLTALITGPGKGEFPAGTYPEVVVERNRNEPFREFTIIFHDEIGIVQAFDVFEDPFFEHTLHSGRDAFAINYGTGGIGAEILANRFGVGPMWDCNDCKYEEMFLSSWAVGDPAMVVDVPANADLDGDGEPDPGPKATKALFPDDPSNVYHSYINDHVKFRNLHAGPKEHHIFHLHAHQWLHTPDSDNSTYLDSQEIGPGDAYTYEQVYDGGGNRPKTPGDAIFHCHFYPHFAMGMWGLWRVHDVFEQGTELDADGRPVPGARALPDGEIAAGTPIPAIVPLPGKALAPMPGTMGNPGYPFFIPGIAGHRPPRPPLETVFDGGLPRHVVQGGESEFLDVNLFDFHKEAVTLDAVQLPETGTATEVAAMNYHAVRHHPTYMVDPQTLMVHPDTFITNGLPGAPGAPYADPCVDDLGNPTGASRVYKAAGIQLDAKFNKKGWHFPQHRMFALWEDVLPYLTEQRAPEPMFLRTNTGDCITYHLVNLIPNEYDLDDFQVQTPTDVIGQHIHLVKFDVTSSDGAANGFNYEDGSFSPEETVERIRAIRRFNGCTGLDSGDPRDGTFTCPVPEAHPFFGATGPNGEDWRGAVETVQRWYTDDVLNAQGEDRTLRTIFTHDHFGPSTHQQNGLYAGLVAEPAGSAWRHPETGELFGTRADGGPTSWQAIIETADPDSSYREFNFAIADFTLAYQADNNGFPDPENAINPPGQFEPDPILPDLRRPPVAGACPNGTPAPCPEMISADDPGTMVVNYRNEPIALRVRDPATNTQAPEPAGDLSLSFSSNISRADPDMNVQPGFYPALTSGLLPRDPFTPMMRVFEGDRVQVRVLVGAHEEGHNFSIHGQRWLFEPADSNSGFRNSQAMGISEHFEFDIPQVPGLSRKSEADFLYRAGSSTDDLWNGMWGLMRVYRNSATNLLTLPSNTDAKVQVANNADFNGVCPVAAPVRHFDVTAVLAQNALPGGTLVYNSRTVNGGPLHDPTAILYVRTSDLDANGMLKPGVPVEPLILRANAGDCIELTLRNALATSGTPMPDLDGYNTLPMIIDQFNANHIVPSRKVGLHPQLLEYDVTRSDGAQVGVNQAQLADPGKTVTYQWYAGRFIYRPNTGELSDCEPVTETSTTETTGETSDSDSSLGTCGSNANGEIQVGVPVEYGAINLMSSDPIQHSNKGAIGVMIIEPKGATWVEDADTRASATVTLADGSEFRDFVVVYQDDINLRFGSAFTPPGFIDDETGELITPSFAAGDPVPNTAESEDPEDSAQKAFNYRTEPMWFRMGFAPNEALGSTRGKDFTNVLSNAQVGGDPETPIFTAEVGTPVRFRVLEPGGHSRNHALSIHGHVFQEQPYVAGSTRIGDNPLSEWKGSRGGHGPTNHFDYVLEHGAGGAFGVVGDYLYRDLPSFQFDGGLWGIMRVVFGTQ